MKKIIPIIGLITLVSTSCNNNQTNKNDSIDKEKINEIVEINPKGLELMQQKCFVCHFKKPDPSRKGQMIAPPMLRVQEHYKPVYPNKGEFVKAVMSMVTDPKKENTLMPGAIRKFNLMPKIAYNQTELRLIAETLYDIDFGVTPDMHKKSQLKLNDGNKWKLKEISIEQINAVKVQLKDFDSEDIIEYNKLGKSLFENTKTILTDKSYSGELFEQLHVFFNGIEKNMHILMATKSLSKAKDELAKIKHKYNLFGDFFE